MRQPAPPSAIHLTLAPGQTASRPQPTSQADAAWLTLYRLAVAGLCWLLVDRAAFGLIDDQFLLDPAYLHGHWRILWGDPSGRFYPLCGREFLILREAGLVSAPLYYGVQAAKLAAGAWCVQSILRRAGAGGGMVFVVGLFVFGGPAFMVSVSRLFVGELTSFTLFLAAIALLGRTRSVPGLALALTGATLALYCKETGFLAVGTMGAVLAWLSRRTDPRLALAGACLTGTAGLFLATYYLFGFSYMQEGGYTAGRTLGLLATAAFFARNDAPLAAMLLLGGLYCLRQARAGRTPPLETACLAGGLAYVGAFLVLRIATPWYLLPAYAFALPAAAAALVRAGQRLPQRLGAAAFWACLALGGLWSVAGYSFLDFNQAAAAGTGRFLTHLKAAAPPPEAPPAQLFLPRMADNAEPARNLRTLLALDGLAQAYTLSGSGLYDLFSSLDAHPEPAVITPYTRISPQEARLLGQCRTLAFATRPPGAVPAALAGFFGLSAPDGADRARLPLAGAYMVYEALAQTQAAASDRPPCPTGFDWKAFRGHTSVTGVKICPLTRASLPFRLTNTSARTFLRAQADPTGAVGLVLFAVKPGESPRPLATAPLPQRLEPGEGVDMRMGFSVFTQEPGVLGVALAMVAGQDVHFVSDTPLISSNYLPRFGKCWEHETQVNP